MIFKISDIKEEQTLLGLKTTIVLNEGIIIIITGGLNKKTDINKILAGIKKILAGIKKIVNEKPDNIEERKIIFTKLVNEKLKPYPDINIKQNFIDYWTEYSINGKKMRAEKEPVFDINKRFSTWLRNSKNNFGKEFGQKQFNQIHIPAPIRQSEKIEPERTPEQQRQDLIQLCHSAFHCQKENITFGGGHRVYDFLISEKILIITKTEEEAVKKILNAKIDSIIYDYKLDNRISPNKELKADDIPNINKEQLFKKIAIKRFLCDLIKQNKELNLVL